MIKTYAKIRRKIRHLRRMMKIYRNEARYYRDAATYHQAVCDDVVERFQLTEPIDVPNELEA